MAFIAAPDQDRIRAKFDDELEGDVRLVLFVQPPSGLYVPGREEPQTGRETKQLMEELVALSPKLQLEVHDPRQAADLAQQFGVTRNPALVLLPADEVPEGAGQAGPGAPAAGEPAPGGVAPAGPAPERGLVRFFGLPSGYEFMTLLEDIVDVSRQRTRLSEATRQAIAALAEPVHLQVFVTPT